MQTYFLVVGLLCVAGGLVLLAQRIWFFFTARRALGQVEEVQERNDVEMGRQFTAIVNFRTKAGATVRFRTQRLHPRVGDLLPVYHAPHDTQHAYVGDILGFWAAPVALLALGAGGVLAGLELHW